MNHKKEPKTAQKVPVWSFRYGTRQRVPGYLLHKPTGQARVRINGKDHWLGKHGSPESHQQYAELIEEFVSGNEIMPTHDYTVSQVIALFWRRAKQRYGSARTWEVRGRYLLATVPAGCMQPHLLPLDMKETSRRAGQKTAALGNSLGQIGSRRSCILPGP